MVELSPACPVDVDCTVCRHHYVTSDRRFAHGCHAIGFRSEQLPSTVVLESSGIPCRLFAPSGSRTE
jgi:hypothetical protein